MYPRLLEIPLGGDLTITIYSYGFMVAVAILFASWLTGRELDRLQKEGRFGTIRVPARGKPGKGPKTTTVRPSDLMGTITIIAAAMGVVGSKLFHILENFGRFMQDPFGMIFSTGGLTFYGGLICAGLSIAWYAHRKGIHVPTLADAIAPSLMIAYGIGRIGCHLAGDGDWGIVSNMALKPSWLPTWLWAETYPHNILQVTLPQPGVYPTSIYEFLASVLLFAVLWSLRRHPYKAGWLFMVYLALNGLERLLIEQIRVNNTFDFFGLIVTQAEVIATVLLLVGIVGAVILTRKRNASRGQSRTPAVKAS
ncbi:MAG: prolipoprotein diacylglyceryl transferase [Rhodothermales bacterium]